MASLPFLPMTGALVFLEGTKERIPVTRARARVRGYHPNDKQPSPTDPAPSPCKPNPASEPVGDGFLWGREVTLTTKRSHLIRVNPQCSGYKGSGKEMASSEDGRVGLPVGDKGLMLGLRG